MDKETTINNIIDAYNSDSGSTILDAKKNDNKSIGILNSAGSILRIYDNVTYHLRKNKIKNTDTIHIDGELLVEHPVNFSGRVKKGFKFLSKIMEGIDYHPPKPVYHKDVFVYFNETLKKD